MIQFSRIVRTAVAAAFAATATLPGQAMAQAPAERLHLTSPAFTMGGEIPQKYTCDGDDVSYPLEWTGVPEGTESLVLIVHDPDVPDPAAPERLWVHWVIVDLPPDSTGLPEGVTAEQLPAGARMGRNDWKRNDFGGPCPPIGRHRYFHRLYALDIKVGNTEPLEKGPLERAMKRHMLAVSELHGTYQRPTATPSADASPETAPGTDPSDTAAPATTEDGNVEPAPSQAPAPANP